MKINKIDKIKDKYAISLNNQTYVISLFLKTKYKISTEKEFTLQEVLTIIQEATLEMYDEILSKKLVKAMTEAEVRQFLLEKNCDYQTIDKLIDTYKGYGYINDYHYIIKYIESNRHKQGKLLIEKKLLDKGIHPNLLNSILSHHKEAIDAENIVIKKLKTIKNKTKDQASKTIYQTLVSRGFNEDLSQALVLKHISSFAHNDQTLLQKMYTKSVYKYPDKNKLISHLMSKGFTYQDILNQIEEGHKDADN